MALDPPKQMTKLHQFSGRIIEAGWLACVIVVPLYFNVYSSRVFEPDKLTFLRSIAVIMIGAQVVRWSEERPALSTWAALRQNWRQWRTLNPLLLPVLLLLAVYVVTSLTSIAPRLSFFGSYERLQGTVTTFCYAVIFLFLASYLRSRVQIERLMTTMLLTSVPITLYGLIQHLQLDPLPWGGNVDFRVTSTMGNAIFLAAYLVMVIPLTAARFLQAVHQARDSSRPESGPIGPFLLSWGGIIAAQNVVLALLLILHASIPGIWWIFPAILGLFLLLSTSERTFERSRRLARIEAAALAVLLLAQVTCAFLTQSRGPLIGLMAAGALFVLLIEWIQNRRAFVLSFGVLVALGLVLVVFNLPRSPIARYRTVPYFGRLGQLTDLSDGTGEVRRLIWQGTLKLLETHPSIGLTPDPLAPVRDFIGYGPETMHLAYYPVYSPRLGDIESRNATPDRNHNDLLDYLVMTGVIGLIAYVALILAALRLGWKLLAKSDEAGEQFLLAALMAIIIGHIVETQSGIAIAATRTYLFADFGVLAALWALHLRPSPAATASPSESTGGSFVASSTAKNRRHRRGRAATISTPTGDVRPIPDLNAKLVLASYVGTVAVGEAIILLAAFGNAQILTLASFGWLAFSLFGWAAARGKLTGTVNFQTRSLWIGGIAGLIGLIVIVINLNQVAADVYHKQGTLLDARGDYPNSIYSFEQAINLAPQQDFYYLFLGRSYLEFAKQKPRATTATFHPTLDQLLQLTPPQVNALNQIDALDAAEVALQRARVLQPLNPDHYANLARLYRFWGESVDPTKLREAELYYRDAVALSPNTAQLRVEWAMTLMDDNKVAEALKQATIGVQMDPAYGMTHVVLGDIELQQKNTAAALDQYKQALADDPTSLADPNFQKRVDELIAENKAADLVPAFQQALLSHPQSAPLLNTYAFLLARLGRAAPAAAMYQKLLALNAKDWLAAKNLALTQQRLGNVTAALQAANEALANAPAGQKTQIQQLITALQKQAH